MNVIICHEGAKTESNTAYSLNNAVIKVIDVNGIIQDIQVTGKGNNSKQIRFNKMGRGMYFVEVTCKGKTDVGKTGVL